MQAELFDLITKEEQKHLKHNVSNKKISELTVLDLNYTCLFLMKAEGLDTEQKSICLAAKAIEILTKRAMEKDLPIF